MKCFVCVHSTFLLGACIVVVSFIIILLIFFLLPTNDYYFNYLLLLSLLLLLLKAALTESKFIVCVFTAINLTKLIILKEKYDDLNY